MASLNARLEDIDSNSENVNIYISFNVSNCVSTKLDSTNFLFCTEVLNMVESHVFTGFLGGCIPPPKTKSISLSNVLSLLFPILYLKHLKNLIVC